MGLSKKKGQAQGTVQPPPLKRRLQAVLHQGTMPLLSHFAGQRETGQRVLAWAGGSLGLMPG